MAKELDKSDVVIDCEHCEYVKGTMGDRKWSCPYCNDQGTYTRVWYYGLDKKVFEMGETVTHRDGEVWEKGTLVKVVMCSRFGDVGLTKDLAKEYGYDIRVDPNILRQPEEMDERPE